MSIPAIREVILRTALTAARVQNFVKAYLYRCKRQSAGAIFSSRCDWINKRRPRRTLVVRTESAARHTQSCAVYMRPRSTCSNIILAPRTWIGGTGTSNECRPIVAIFPRSAGGRLVQVITPTPLAVSAKFLTGQSAESLACIVHHPSRQFLQWWRRLPLVVVQLRSVRLKYKGKSYKWARKQRALVLRFNFAHLVFLPVPTSILYKKKKKMQLKFYGACRWELQAFCTAAIKWRPMNTYHGRGLRLAKQRVFRKSGKVSAYR